MTRTIALQPGQKILNHEWYRAWECGALPVESLQHYAREYYWQVANFPRYLSLLHSQLEDLSARQAVLGNLSDEENQREPHPELWLDFAEALGLDRADVRSGKPGPAAAALVEEFRALVAAGPASGLGAILAYESQVPEVAKFKTAALKQHYLAADAEAKGTRFFAVHEAADVWHTEEMDRLVEKLSPADRAVAQASAEKAGAALWRFLDAMPGAA